MINFTDIENKNQLANILNIELKYLTYILYIKKVDNYYKEFEIPKKNGEIRKIHAPTDRLKDIQKNLSIILSKYQSYPYSENYKGNKISHAFEKNKSIITNAKIHRNKKYVFNVDLECFFDSFHFGRVKGFFEKNKIFALPNEIAIILAQLCCYKGCLPQGAPTSPIITNLICKILDIRLLKIAKSFKLDYTRYADDLTFSTNDNAFLENQTKFINLLIKEINRAGFKLNDKKTRLQYNTSRQEVTGLVVNKKINVKKSYYKNTRAMAYTLYRKGNFTINGVSSENINKLEGRFSFINQLDKYNNLLSEKKRDFHNLNSREKEYQKFLFYKYFFSNEKPLLVTEGKTDIVYIKSALKNLYTKYPNLVSKKDDGTFEFKISFLNRTKKLHYFMNFGQDGANPMKNLYNFFDSNNSNPLYPNYLNYFSTLSNKTPNFPVIFIFDNELKNKSKPLSNFINHIKLDKAKLSKFKKDYKINLVDNLYLLTNQLLPGKSECEIEDLFDEHTLNHKISGKTFNRTLKKLEGTNYYSKEIFSNYISQNYKTINFDNFEPFLNNLNEIVSQSISHKEIELHNVTV
ncbi:retron Ec67 family RNA-directed DNA polymerase/endonuclease [Clostridium baratii]|uniref:retron Ec67 family RNA-directed DNA polymerase/endonuclease n=1 Tax=Clostridium baratii TaxID=1561 RepID=UPI0029012765|nr:retron Ec67 family RNA-directed DNA polymerase/endonuclease [Clostridium baratii]MDU1053820.1 retron Ec67 family RNA-directed DNA polymerase/endonuclease [Clostridium baratii]